MYCTFKLVAVIVPVVKIFEAVKLVAKDAVTALVALTA